MFPWIRVVRSLAGSLGRPAVIWILSSSSSSLVIEGQERNSYFGRREKEGKELNCYKYLQKVLLFVITIIRWWLNQDEVFYGMASLVLQWLFLVVCVNLRNQYVYYSRISIAHLPPGRIACAHSRSFRMFGNISHQEGHTLYYHEACVSTRGFNEANTVFTADTTTVTTKRWRQLLLLIRGGERERDDQDDEGTPIIKRWK